MYFLLKKKSTKERIECFEVKPSLNACITAQVLRRNRRCHKEPMPVTNN